MPRFDELAGLIWSVADLLRGNYKQADYGKVILPFTILRRLDCVLGPTKAAVLAELGRRKDAGIANLAPFLTKQSGYAFYNTSQLDFQKLADDPAHIGKNLTAYVAAFSENARDIFEQWKFADQIAYLDEANLLYLVVQKFRQVDLHPDQVPNHEMGLAFEELIRRFAEQSNETAGEHFTPREVIRLMVDLLFLPDTDVLGKPGVVRRLYDPTAGTGGMLSVAEEYVRELNADATLKVFGQELNPESYAICKSDMLIKGQDVANIVRGDTLAADGHAGRTFDYMLANPPFGVEWKKSEQSVRDEHAKKGYAGRFGPGLPRINDGSLLFLLHMLSKMDAKTGSRIGIVFNGSPLFTGDAGSGESEIRRWILENDWLDAIVALPTELFYNTGIATYIWILDNRKPEERQGKVQLINAVSMGERRRKSLGQKRNDLGEQDIQTITRLYGEYVSGDQVRIFPREHFGFRKITVERPLRLSFQVTPERIARLDEQTAWRKLTEAPRKGAQSAAERIEGEAIQRAVRASLAEMDPTIVYRSRDAFRAALDAALAPLGRRVSGPVRLAIVAALGERDPEAEPCRAADGTFEPDPELRDTESVPLTEDPDRFFAREVRPHVPDAWVSADVRDSKDGEVGRVGYEINFNRYFYRYTPPRPLEVINAEIKALEADIVRLLGEVTA